MSPFGILYNVMTEVLCTMPDFIRQTRIPGMSTHHTSHTHSLFFSQQLGTELFYMALAGNSLIPGMATYRKSQSLSLLFSTT